MQRINMDCLLCGRVVLNLVPQSMAKSVVKLKCRFASKSMPQGYDRLLEGTR
jgi:hypothetical protein